MRMGVRPAREHRRLGERLDLLVRCPTHPEWACSQRPGSAYCRAHLAPVFPIRSPSSLSSRPDRLLPARTRDEGFMRPTEFKELARRAHERALQLARLKKKATAELAYLLADMSRRELYAAYSCTNVYEYAVKFGITASIRHARELVQLVADLEKLPKIRHAFLQGELDWTKTRTIAAVATPETEDRWLADARRLTNAELEAKAREEKGEAAPVHWKLKLSREDSAEVEQSLVVARALYGRRMTDEEAFVAICRDFRLVQAGGYGKTRSSRNPANRIVITRCGDCGRHGRRRVAGGWSSHRPARRRPAVTPSSTTSATARRGSPSRCRQRCAGMSSIVTAIGAAFRGAVAWGTCTCTTSRDAR